MIVADTHVHIYPGYDTGAFFRAARAALAAREREARAAGGEGGETVHVLALAEAAPHRAFDALRGAAEAGGEAAPGVRPLPTSDPVALRIDDGAAPALYLLAGRQLVTAERVEVLALAGDPGLPDGLPLAETLERIRGAGAVPVLPWAPGKWFFSRGRLVAAILAGAAPGTLLLGDTSLRPTVWPTPRLLHAARRKGVGVLAGSDPLPPAADAASVGRYVSVLRGTLDPARPAASFRERLLDPAAAPRGIGQRGGPLETAARLAAHRREKRRG